MRLFPLFADLNDKNVLVVGGGAVAARKIGALLRSGARVTVVAPEVRADILAWEREGRVQCLLAEFAPQQLEGMWLVIAATDDRAVNMQVSAAAHADHMLVNVVDDPELSTFQVPSIVDRAPLVVAISTGGAAPVFARRVRERVETLLDHSIGQLARLASERREAIRRAYPDMAARRRLYDWLFDGPVAAALRAGHPQQALAACDLALDGVEPPLAGRILLVGAGPGPAAMLTLQALRALNEADVIVYTTAVSEDVLDLARRDAERVVWPTPTVAALSLTAYLAAQARSGACVVYLTPGDAQLPEDATAAWSGVAYEVVRGLA